MADRIRKTGITAGNLKVPAAAIFLAAIVVLIYLPAARHEFIRFDDEEYVYENTVVRKGITAEGIAWAFTTDRAGNWHPLTWLSHMLDCELFGLDPGKHHIVSVVIHAANAVLLFLVLFRMTGAFWPGVIAAALFAVHPLRVESVAWIAERKDVLCGFFWLLTIMAYSFHVRRPTRRRYALVVFTFVLSLLAKPMAVTLPLVLLLLDFRPLGLTRFSGVTGDGDRAQGALSIANQRKAVWHAVLEKAPLFLLSAASGIVTFFVQAKGGAVSGIEALPVHLRFANALVSYVRYIVKTIAPVRLALVYPHQRDSLQLWLAAAAGVLLAAVTYFAIRERKRFPFLFIGWIWYLVTLLPVIGLIQVGSQGYADRYTYLPSIGLIVAAVWGVSGLAPGFRYRRMTAAIAAAAIIAALAAASRAQVLYWRDSVTLFERTLEVTDGNYLINNNLGIVLNEQGMPEKALGRFAEAIRIEPDFVAARMNIAMTLSDLGRFDEASLHFEEALKREPDNSKTHNNYGIVLARRGMSEQAMEHFEEALRLEPDSAEAHNNLGMEIERTGRLDDALAHYRRTIEIEPENAEANNNIGNIHQLRGDLEKAREHYKKALEINPNYAKVHYNLGIIAITLRDTTDAKNLYLKAIKLDPDLAEAYNNLANIFAANGRYDEAITHYRKAIDLKPDYSEAKLNLKTILDYMDRIK